MKYLYTILILILLITVHIDAQSDSSLNISYLGYWGDGQNRQVQSLASKGNLIAVGLESFFQLVDYSNPSWPQTKGDYHLWGQGFVKEIGLNENAAYLYTRNGGGKIMDISDIENLELIGDISLGRYFTFYNDLLVGCNCPTYVPRFGLYNISDPLNPEFLNNLEFQYSCEWFRIQVYNNIIFFLGKEVYPQSVWNFLIIDVSDPSSPVILLEQLNSLIRNFIVSEQLLVTMEAGSNPGIYTYDISNPSIPEELGYYESNGWILGIENDYCYYTPGIIPANKIVMLDISDPSDIVNSGYYFSADFNFVPAWTGLTLSGHTKISGSRIYHANGTNRVYLLKNDLITAVEKSEMYFASFNLQQNFPNPFNPTTKIKFTISDLPAGRQGLRFTILKVYDVLGKEVATLVNEEKPIGEYEVEFNGTGLPSGIYFYQLRAGNYVGIKKMIFLK